MKIIVAGPYPQQNKNGGVAVFDENLLKVLSKDNKVLLVTNKIPVDQQNLNIEYANLCELKKIHSFNADIIISSLWYSLFFLFGFSRASKIHILHGFTNLVSYSWLKFNIMHLIDKIIRMKFDYFLANSLFTKFVNEEFFGLKVDGTFTIGLDSELIEHLKRFNKSKAKENNIMFLGRIVKAKKIEVAIKAVSKIDKRLYDTFNIYGYGNEKRVLEKKYSWNKKIIFAGPINHEEVMEAYEKSKVFISLNPSEPFGITYEEAVANGLFVVAPNTGGQVDFLKQFPERIALVNVDNIDSICAGIEKGLRTELPPLTAKQLNNMDYCKTAKEIISVINK